MTIVPVMWAVWGLLVVATIAISIYQSRMTRDEEDQIFLSDGFEHEKVHQSAIQAKVGQIQPILKACKWMIAAATLFVVGYYIVDAINQFK